MLKMGLTWAQFQAATAANMFGTQVWYTVRAGDAKRVYSLNQAVVFEFTDSVPAATFTAYAAGNWAAAVDLVEDLEC